MIIRNFKDDDAEKVSSLIIRTLKTTNSKDYSEESIKALEKQMQPSHIFERASWTHFYVVEDNDTIIGCGAIGLRSGHIGAAKPRAVCSRYLFCRNIKVWVSAEKSLKRLNRTSIFSEQNA